MICYQLAVLDVVLCVKDFVDGFIYEHSQLVEAFEQIWQLLIC